MLNEKRKAAQAAAQRVRREAMKAADPEGYRRLRNEENRRARERREANETPEQRKHRLALRQEAQKRTRANLSEEERKRRRQREYENRKRRGMTAEQKDRQNFYNRRYRQSLKARTDPEAEAAKERQREAHRRWLASLTPEQHQRRIAQNTALKARIAAEQRRSRPAIDFAGSVLAAAAPSPWRDMLAQITALVPKIEDREDIIAEAALLVLEGARPADAVKAARKTLTRIMNERWKSVPVEDCHWL